MFVHGARTQEVSEGGTARVVLKNRCGWRLPVEKALSETMSAINRPFAKNFSLHATSFFNTKTVPNPWEVAAMRTLS